MEQMNVRVEFLDLDFGDIHLDLGRTKSFGERLNIDLEQMQVIDNLENQASCN